MISTAVKHGLEDDEPFIGITLTEDFQEFIIEYWSETCGKVLETQTCKENDVLSCLAPILERLLKDTQGRDAAV